MRLLQTLPLCSKAKTINGSGSTENGVCCQNGNLTITGDGILKQKTSVFTLQQRYHYDYRRRRNPGCRRCENDVTAIQWRDTAEEEWHPNLVALDTLRGYMAERKRQLTERKTVLTAKTVLTEKTVLMERTVLTVKTALTEKTVLMERTVLTAKTVLTEKTVLTVKTALTAKTVLMERTVLTAKTALTVKTVLTAKTVLTEKTVLTAKTALTEKARY